MNTLNIEELTLKQLREIGRIILSEGYGKSEMSVNHTAHPMLNRLCLIRTYSAGVHIGIVRYINPQNSMEIQLQESLRLWKWEGGGLSLSAVANEGIKGGRLNKTGEIFLTNAIEFIPVTTKAWDSYAKYIE